jgi:hypothetical protein
MLVGDGFRLAGVFLVHQGEIRKSYRHADSADRPDYLALASSLSSSSSGDEPSTSHSPKGSA